MRGPRRSVTAASPPPHARRSARRAYCAPRRGDSPLLLRRRLPVLVHGVACRRGGRGRWARRGRVAPVRAATGARARCSRCAATTCGSTGRSNVYARAQALGVEIHLPRYQPRSTLPLAACLWADERGSPAGVQARALRGVLLRRRGHRDRPSRSARAAERAGLDPGGGGRRRLRPGASRQAARDPRGGRGGGCRGRAVAPRRGRAVALGHGRRSSALLAGESLVPRAPDNADAMTALARVLDELLAATRVRAGSPAPGRARRLRLPRRRGGARTGRRPRSATSGRSTCAGSRSCASSRSAVRWCRTTAGRRTTIPPSSAMLDAYGGLAAQIVTPVLSGEQARRDRLGAPARRSAQLDRRGDRARPRPRRPGSGSSSENLVRRRRTTAGTRRSIPSPGSSRATRSCSRRGTGSTASSRATAGTRTAARSTSVSGHPLTGPVFVDGAEPGDVLAVEILGYETPDVRRQRRHPRLRLPRRRLHRAVPRALGARRRRSPARTSFQAWPSRRASTPAWWASPPRPS